MKIRRIPRCFPLEEIPWDRGEWLGLIFPRGNPLKRLANTGETKLETMPAGPSGKQVQLNTWNFVALCLFTIGSNPKHKIVLTRFFCCICSDAHYFLIPKPKKTCTCSDVLPFNFPAARSELRHLRRDGAQQLWLIGGLGLLA